MQNILAGFEISRWCFERQASSSMSHRGCWESKYRAVILYSCVWLLDLTLWCLLIILLFFQFAFHYCNCRWPRTYKCHFDKDNSKNCVQICWTGRWSFLSCNLFGFNSWLFLAQCKPVNDYQGSSPIPMQTQQVATAIYSFEG